MEKRARGLTGHYIVCGAGSVGQHILAELAAGKRPCVALDQRGESLREAAAHVRELVHFEGDATDDDMLFTAGITRARGLFAATSDDNTNLVITLTARQLNAGLEIVSRCREPRNMPKLKAAGATHVVSTSLIGGLRMASEMVRPTVVSFLDIMLRDRDKNLRVEEVEAGHAGDPISTLELERFSGTLLLAVRDDAGWTYNPPRDHVLGPHARLIVMTTPADRVALEAHLTGAPPGAPE